MCENIRVFQNGKSNDWCTKKPQIKNEPTGKKHKKGIIIVLGFGAIERI